MTRIGKILLLMSLLASCARAPDASESKPLAVAEWQFIDAETMQPIEGAFINFAWRGESTSRGMTTCKHGVLGRTDKNGWFRSVAKDPTWYADGTPAFFVPGYEYFKFRYGYPDAEHITATIAEDKTVYGNYPAFEERMHQNGYEFQGEISADRQFSHVWTKVMPAAGFHDRMRDQKNPRRYFVKYQTYPELVDQTFQFVGKVCSDEGATNEVDREMIQLSDHLRGYHATKYFCDPAWNSIAYARLEISIWIRRATWILPKGSGFKPLEELIPEYFKDASKSGMLSRNLTAAERAKMCEALNVYLKNGESL
jgi:hypothetical protein